MIDPILFTIPHSGTRFTIGYFEFLGFRRWNINLSKLRRITDVGVLFHQQHTGEWMQQGHFQPSAKYALENNKVIVTVRHPHLVLDTFLARGKTLEINIECWKSLIEWLPKTDHYIFDIGCAENRRFQQMYGILEHIGANNLDTYRITQEYVEEWKPMNVTPNKNIEVHDYSELDFAVEWYKNLPSTVHT
jgi:hypothetical protein